MKNITLVLILLLITQISFCQTKAFGESTKAMSEAIINEDTTKMAEIIEVEIAGDNSMEEKNMCLLLVCDFGIMQSTKYLIGIGADIDCISPQNGRTPLLTAAAQGHRNIIKYLLAEGADINAKDVMSANALILASMDGNIELAKVLVNSGIDIHAKMDGGYNARDMAKGKEVKKYLKEKGVK